MKWLLTFAALCGMLLPAFAQDISANAPGGLPNIQDSLSLTEDQVDAVMPIVEKYASQRQELRESLKNGILSTAHARPQMKQIKQQERRELAKYLSAAQLSRWDALYKARHKDRLADGGREESNGNGTSSAH
ncbi:MAG: hypothetical protein KGK03_04060 [Candidatus Omnitrophica bacterium]|nr:hypothetical protein [Candidatus Omnitrophota bacterium]MDE2222228.1 hypothetical protein [Candidatus Omnitrophota bacterium]